MSTLIYGPVELQIVHTESIDVQPILDPTQADFLYSRVTIRCRCVWSEASTATNVGLGGNAPDRGDRVGVTLRNLKQSLVTPRQLLVYRIGNDEVYRAPPTLNVPPNGLFQAPTDAEAGPKVLDCRVSSVLGSKAAIVHFAVQFVVFTGGNLILSNRFLSHAVVDEDWFTTKITRGRAVLRGDLLRLNGWLADQFRQNFLVPVPLGFKRERIDVRQNESGTELDWTVTDRQQGLNLGADSDATRVEGSVTVGIDSPIKSAADVVSLGGKLQNSLQEGPFAPLTTAVKGTIPVPRAHCHICAWGSSDTPRENLNVLVIGIALDRLAPLGGIAEGANSPKIASAYLSQSVHTPYVELRAEFYMGVRAFFNAARHPLHFGNFMNLSRDVKPGGGYSDMLGRNGRNPPPPNDGGTRGTWVGKLLAQVLATPGEVPPLPLQADVDADTFPLPAQ